MLWVPTGGGGERKVYSRPLTPQKKHVKNSRDLHGRNKEEQGAESGPVNIGLNFRSGVGGGEKKGLVKQRVSIKVRRKERKTVRKQGGLREKFDWPTHWKGEKERAAYKGRW